MEQQSTPSTLNPKQTEPTASGTDGTSPTPTKELYVIKRNGDKEKVEAHKIKERLEERK